MNRIKKMKFDEAFAKYRRYLIASSIANTYEEAIKEWEVIKVENRPNKDLISFNKRISSYTGCTIRNLHTKILLGQIGRASCRERV